MIKLIVFFAFATSAFSQSVTPTQAEFDPILENADNKVRDFLRTLREYQTEARSVDDERLEKDLQDFERLRQMIQAAHGGKGKGGITVSAAFAITTSLDDAAMEASVWSNLLTAKVCDKNERRLLAFALAVQSNGGMLREVSGQMFHPSFRLMSAIDDIMNESRK